MRIAIVFICSLIVGLALPAETLAKRWSDPEVRAKELSPRKCATTLKRRLTFAKYWGPSPKVYTLWQMYHPKRVGFWGYLQLGDLHFYGCENANLAPDKAAAARWYQEAALGHIAEAQLKLGRMLVAGDGVPLDRVRGLAWLTSAALEGDPDAPAELRRLGVQVPDAIRPTSYEVAQAKAKAVQEQGQAEYWAGVRRDLGELLLSTAAIYVGTTMLGTAPTTVVTRPEARRRWPMRV